MRTWLIFFGAIVVLIVALHFGRKLPSPPGNEWTIGDSIVIMRKAPSNSDTMEAKKKREKERDVDSASWFERWRSN